MDKIKKSVLLLVGVIALMIPAASSAEFVLKEKMVTITKTPTGTLNVRKDPNGNSPVIAQIKTGERYLRVNKTKVKRWYQIKLTDGRLGWISTQYAKQDRGHPGVPTKGNDFKINSDGVITGGGPSIPQPPPPGNAPAEKERPVETSASTEPAAVAPSTDSVRIKVQELSASWTRVFGGSDAPRYTNNTAFNLLGDVRLDVPGWKVDPCLRLEARYDPYDFATAGLDTDLRYSHQYGQAIACLGYQTAGSYSTYIEGGVGAEMHDSKDVDPVFWARFQTEINKNWFNRFWILTHGKERTEVGERVSYKYDGNWTFGVQSQVRVHGTGDLRRYMWDVGPVVSRQLSPGIQAELRGTYSPFAGYGAAVGLSFTSP